MTQQEKDEKIKEITNFCKRRTNSIESLIERGKIDKINMDYFGLIAAQNEIIILMLTPVTNDIQNPLHY